MELYEKTIWENEETYLNELNMNKIEDQLEKLTNNAISEGNKGYVTNDELDNKNYATETFVTETINEVIGSALSGSY